MTTRVIDMVYARTFSEILPETERLLAERARVSKSAGPTEGGQVLGVNQSFGSVARAAGMAISGFLYGYNFHLPFLAGAGIMILCIWLAGLIHPAHTGASE